MTEKDRPTREFSRGQVYEYRTTEGKSCDPRLYYQVVWDREYSDYHLEVFTFYGGTGEDQVQAFGGLVDRTVDSCTYEPCPIGFTSERKKAAKALKEGRLREFIEDAIKDRYDKWHENLQPEIRELLTDFSLAYWRREIYLDKEDEQEAGPAGPSGDGNTGNNPNIGNIGVTGGLS